ncbi:MAG: hypothetical protein EBS13_08560 [Verrucomicrobia bacterium]|nr:hypothetical protein [Verrucomicrobiota bacterium]
MNRSVEIIAILRKGMEKMLSKAENLRVNYTRIFNFNENRVSLRMEVAESETPFTPMGRIDVVELPTNNGRITCNCTLTELQTGQSSRIVLRLKDSQERERECEKVFGFFRNILSLPDENSVTQPVIPVDPPKADGSDVGPVTGFPLDSSRGAQSKEDKPND